MGIKYTEMAVQALTFADLFNLTFKEPLAFGGLAYRIELSTPDGPSTAGGRQATQHVKLVPSGDGVTLVMGSANSVAKVAELRIFEALGELHAQRFPGAELPVDRSQYEKLLARMEQFFKSQQLEVTAVGPKGAARAAAAAGTSPLPLLVAGILAGLGIVGAAAWFLLN